MSQKRYLAPLTPDERGHPADLLRKGKASARVRTRARIPLAADRADGGPALADAVAAAELGVGVRTIGRVRQWLVGRGLEGCLRRKAQDEPSRERKRDGTAGAKLIAPACSGPPGDRDVWAAQVLAARSVGLKVVDAVSDETVRRALQKTRPGRGSRSSGASRPGRAGRSSRRRRT